MIRSTIIARLSKSHPGCESFRKEPAGRFNFVFSYAMHLGCVRIHSPPRSHHFRCPLPFLNRFIILPEIKDTYNGNQNLYHAFPACSAAAFPVVRFLVACTVFILLFIKLLKYEKDNSSR